MSKIAIVGAGNVGSHLCRAFSSSGHEITVFTRRGADHLLDDVSNLVWTHHLSALRRGFDFVILAINDQAIGEVSPSLKIEDGILLHTSGSTEMGKLSGSGTNHYGVFYPLQTFRKDVGLNYKDIPIFIESNVSGDFKKIEKLASCFSGKSIELNSQKRRQLHLSAVFANNFTNHLYRLSADYAALNGIDFEDFLPLIKETARRLEEKDAKSLQTGPARRKDKETIESHLEMLKDLPEIREIYTQLTESIEKHYSS